MRRLVLLTLLAGAAAQAADAPPLDPLTGMKMAGDWEIVRNHCIICHSSKTFLQTRGTESTWSAVLQWMQTRGGLWKLDPQVEKTIVGYLAEHYGPGENFRRAPIPATLMPENPYASDARLEAEAKKKAGLIPAAPAPASAK